jgi:hypothetical protein
VIHQAPGCRDDDVDARLEGAFLRPHLDAAVDGDARQVGVIREALDVVFDLHAQFARGREDQDACEAGVGRVLGARFEQTAEDRQHERDRLPRAGVGAADDVLAGDGNRDHRALDRCGHLEAADRDPFE